MEHRSVTEVVESPIIPNPSDVKDGSYMEPQLLAKFASDQKAANEAAAATCTTTTPGPKASKIG